MARSKAERIKVLSGGGAREDRENSPPIDLYREMDFAGRRQRQAALGPINLEFIAAIICLRIFEGCVEGRKEVE